MSGGVFVKFCGMTRAEDARVAAGLGIDAVGFNFWRGGPREIDPGRAADIARVLPAGVKRFGVFVDDPPSRIVEIAGEVELDAVQLHGDETPERCIEIGELGVGEIYKALRVGPGFEAALLAAYRCAGFLLDGFDPARPGGTGRTFDWERARQVAQDARILIAGGLTPDNVAAAIGAGRPWGVDVASGIESAPGIKDAAKMTAFVAAARQGGRR